MLYHRQQPRYLQPLGPRRIIVRLRTRRIPGQHCQVLYEAGDRVGGVAMYPYAFTPHYCYWQAELSLNRAGEVRYYFRSQAPGEEPSYLLADGTRAFSYRWSSADIVTIPHWLYDAIFYQIFPDRFFNGDPTNDPPGTQPWGDAPTRSNFFGGDLEGIRVKIPYLNYLGINGIWLNPIFAAPSNHRYDTADYLQVDPALGGNQALRQLVDSLHASGIRLILDGVFNHTGTEFWAFRDVLQRGAASPYKDWYYFDDFPVRSAAEPNYACWWNIASLPKLAAINPEVIRYLLGVATYWPRDFGTDGWRLDVPNEIEPPFWEDFRREVKEINRDAYLVGEIWRDARSWLRYFDGVMNYLFRELVLDTFASRRLSLSALDMLLGVIRLRYPEPANFALLNLLDSHDTARVITAFQERLAAVPGAGGTYAEAVTHLRPALILQMTYPGIPLIYYGDEVGMTGGPDPGCRGTMIWEPEKQDRSLLNTYRRLLALRHKLPALRLGAFQPLHVDDTAGVYVYARRAAQPVIIILNIADCPRDVAVPLTYLPRPEGEVWEDGLSAAGTKVREGRLSFRVAPHWGAVIYPLEPGLPPIFSWPPARKGGTYKAGG